jgi:hypothetical protein
LPNEHVVLSAFDGSEGIQVLESSWPVVRNPDLTIKEIEPGDLDELAYPSARAALTSELRRMVAATDFRPWKGYRVALVVGPRAERDMPGLTQKLVVSGAVAGADVEIAPAGDLNDETHLRRLAKFVENNRHQMVFSISKPEESWVSRLMKSFSRRVPWVRLAFQDADVAIEQFDASIENALDTAPGYPLFVWGSDALERIEAYEGDAFQLSRLAKRSLRSNPYPNVERMLEHVEKLAMCANRWHEEGTGGERLEDWVLERFELAIALRDSKLDGSSWTVEYRNSTNPSSHQELDAQPHVKVDDHTDLRHCGRIYFGLERDARVIVVRQVGIHA